MSTTDIMRLPSASRDEESHRFNYLGVHRYVVTMPVHPPQAVFTEPEPVFAVLNHLRETATRTHFDVYAYCFLPSRLELILRGREETSDMKAFLNEFRAASSAALEEKLGKPLWARTYTERVLRKTEDSRAAARALFQVPVKAGLAASPQVYPYLGSFAITLAALYVDRGAPGKSFGRQKGGPPRRDPNKGGPPQGRSGSGGAPPRRGPGQDGPHGSGKSGTSRRPFGRPGGPQRKGGGGKGRRP